MALFFQYPNQNPVCSFDVEYTMVSFDGGVCKQSRWCHSVTVRSKMADIRYYGNVMTTTRWRLCYYGNVMSTTRWRLCVFYIFNSTVIDWTCYMFFFASLFVTLSSHEFSKTVQLFELLTQISNCVTSWEWISTYKTFVLFTYYWQSVSNFCSDQYHHQLPWKVGHQVYLNTIFCLPGCNQYDCESSWHQSSKFLYESFDLRKLCTLTVSIFAVAKLTALNILSWGMHIWNSNSMPVTP